MFFIASIPLTWNEICPPDRLRRPRLGCWRKRPYCLHRFAFWIGQKISSCDSGIRKKKPPA